MTDRVNESDSEFSTFKEWLDETAEREGSSPESVLNQLMSTYWILTELSSVIEETPYSEGGNDSSEDDSGEGSHREIIDVIETMAEMNQQRAEPAPASTSIDPGIIHLIEALREGDGMSGSLQGAAEYRLEKLRDEVAELEREVRELGEQSGELDDTLGKNARNLARLRQDLANLERGIEDRVERLELEELIGQVEEVEGDLGDTESRFEEAYAHIRQILEHLVESTGQQEERLDVIAEALSDSLEDFEESTEGSQRLKDLLRKANREGIRTATCDHCDHVIDLALLPDVHCPGCERELADFVTESGVLRKKHYAKTRSRGRRDDATKRDLADELNRRLDQVSVTSDQPDSLGLDG